MNFVQKKSINLLKNFKTHSGIRQFSLNKIKLDSDEEVEKPKVQRPFYHPSVVPRRRRGLTVESFLEKIGKSCVDHLEHFQSWEDLFTMKSKTMKYKEIPVKQRKWILHWVQKYRNGETPEIFTNGDKTTIRFAFKKKKVKK
eukprot:gene5028-8625_t